MENHFGYPEVAAVAFPDMEDRGALVLAQGGGPGGVDARHAPFDPVGGPRELAVVAEGLRLGRAFTNDPLEPGRGADEDLGLALRILPDERHLAAIAVAALGLVVREEGLGHLQKKAGAGVHCDGATTRPVSKLR